MQKKRPNSKTYTCKKCGNGGHNKRTCGKYTSTNAPTSYTHKNTLPLTREGKRANEADIPKLTSSNLVRMWETLTAENNSDTEKPTEDEVVGDTPNAPPATSKDGSEGYTAEELTTLWFLTHEHTGKGDGGQRTPWGDNETLALLRFVEDIHKSTGEGIEVKEWFKFFKNFSARAKTLLLGKYKGVQSTYTRLLTVIMFDVDENDTPELPTQLFPVFFKDSSQNVREAVIEKAGMPAVLAEIIAQQGTTADKYALLLNEEVSSEVLHSAYLSLKEERLREGEQFLTETIAVRVAQNGKMPKRVYGELFHHPSSYVRSQIYLNRQVPALLKNERSRELREQYFKDKSPTSKRRAITHGNEQGTKLSGWNAETATINSLTYEIRSAIAAGMVSKDDVFKYLMSDTFIKLQGDGLFLSNAIKKNPLTSEELGQLYHQWGGWENMATATVKGFLRNTNTPHSVVWDIHKGRGVVDKHGVWVVKEVTECISKLTHRSGVTSQQ